MSAANSLSSASVGPKPAKLSGSCCTGDSATTTGGAFVLFSTAPSTSSLQQDEAVGSSTGGGGEQSSARARSKVGTQYSSCPSSSSSSSSAFRSSDDSMGDTSGTTTSFLDRSSPTLLTCGLRVRALRLDHAGATCCWRFFHVAVATPASSVVECGSVGRRRRRSCRLASGFAECTEASQPWHRKASSAAQYHRARRLRQLSQARAALPPTAPAACLELLMCRRQS
uniref:Uncharacterized protein n=1 Tax=Zea mays TaxID=4577 RepID=B8A3A0_MAIZE|nr:unknown [Zea mays]